MMLKLPALISAKLYRASEALDLLCFYAADMATRRALVHVYASLSHPERYDAPVLLNLRIGGKTFPFHMRLSDIFIIGEILHERQYTLKSRIPPDATIVDAGGNIGVSAVWFIGHFPQARIHIFEPARENLYYLNRNVAGHEKAEVFQAALGKETGILNLHHGDFTGMHSLLPDAVQSDAAHEEVSVITLADHMEAEGIAKIDLLKLDIEGSEFDALRGLGHRIQDVDVIVGEVHEALIDVDAFYEFVEESGFTVIWRKSFRESEEQQVHGFEAARTSA